MRYRAWIQPSWARCRRRIPRGKSGTTLDIGIGVNVAAQGAWHGWRFAAEYLVPVEQDLNGPQLETDGVFTLGVQRSWN